MVRKEDAHLRRLFEVLGVVEHSYTQTPVRVESPGGQGVNTGTGKHRSGEGVGMPAENGKIVRPRSRCTS